MILIKNRYSTLLNELQKSVAVDSV